MSEEQEQPAVSPETEPAAQSATDSQTDDWRNALPEDIRAADDFKGVNSVAELANKYIVANRFVSTGNEMGQTPEQKTAFFEKYGKPKSEAGYSFKLPAELKDDATVSRFADVMRKSAILGNLTDEQFSAMMDGVLNNSNLFDEDDQAEKTRRNQVMNDYAAKLGENFAPRMNDLNTICRSVGDEFIEHLTAVGAGFDPVIIEGLLKLGDGYVEKSGGLFRSDGGRALTGKEIDAEIDALRKDAAFNNKSDPRHKHVINRIDALYKEKFGQ